MTINKLTRKYNKNKKNKTKKFNKLNCAPGYKINKFSCYDKKTLKYMKKLWNLKHPDDKIDDVSLKDIWLSLKNRLSNICNNEYCWLDSELYKNKLDKSILKDNFNPFHPKSWLKDKNEWLSSNDIIKVMKKYENKYKNFNFIGPSPIDFDNKIYNSYCVYDELCNFNIKKYIKKGIDKIGFIFNTDPHYKSGSHWVALFLDLKKKILFYFDSNGDKIPKQIKKLSNRIIEQAKNLNIIINYDDNYNFVHQRLNSECGMYCLYFIINLLTEKHNFEYFKNNSIKDSHVEKYRKIYFNEPF